jgi:hypothetical protein
MSTAWTAVAQAPSLEAAPPASPFAKPGATADATLTVKYCYNTPPAVPGTVAVALDPPSWLAATATPSQFTAAVQASNCGTQDVQLALQFGRNAPAFQVQTLHITLTPRGGGGSQGNPLALDLPVQADYGAELSVAQPPTLTVQRGDAGVLALDVTVGANEATGLEVSSTGGTGLVTVGGEEVQTGAGNGLDAKVSVHVPLNVTVSPGASPGAQTLVIKVASYDLRQHSILGPATEVRATVQVTQASATPGPSAAVAALAAAFLALGAQRRLRPPSR